MNRLYNTSGKKIINLSGIILVGFICMWEHSYASKSSDAIKKDLKALEEENNSKAIALKHTNIEESKKKLYDRIKSLPKKPSDQEISFDEPTFTFSKEPQNRVWNGVILETSY